LVDELIGRSFGNTDADYLNGLLGLGIITYENTGSRNNKLMDLYLNYNKKVESIDTQFEVTSGYSYQERYYDGFHTILKTTLLLMAPVPSRVNLQSFLQGQISLLRINIY
jgi:iron complex outermembrane receptor protein